MQVQNEAPNPPRSKLEYLYRDLLIECHLLTQRQEALGKQIDEACVRMESFNGQLRQSTHHATQQASTRIQQTVENVGASLQEANRRLLATEKRLNEAGTQNQKVTALIAAAAGTLGGLLGVLVTTFILT